MSEPVDYWREVMRRGVLALGFSLRSHRDQHWMVAELVALQDGVVARAAQAAIEIDKQVDLEPGTAAHKARAALAHSLADGPTARQLAAYQALLAERLWREVQANPAERLEALSYPHR